MTQVSIPTELLNIINTEKSVSFDAVKFHDISVSRFLANTYRYMKTAISEEIDEGFNSDILDKYNCLISQLDAHVYTLTRTDDEKFHSQFNHKFVEAIERFKPTYYKAIANKLHDDRLNLSIFSHFLQEVNAKFKICKELQNDTFISMFH